MGKVSKNVLEKIKKAGIKPIPKWHFMLKNSFIWGLFVVNLVLGAIGFAAVIYLLVNNDAVWDFSLTTNIFQWILLAVPVAWIALALFFLFVAYYNFKNTEDGYRTSVWSKLLINIGIAVLLGLILYTSGFSARMNRLLLDSIPFYSHTLDMREEVWMRPEEGFLSGDILSVDGEEKVIQLRDLKESEWSIGYEDAIVKSRVVLDVGERIKILGSAVSENVFEASEIRPWAGAGRGMQEK